MLLVRKFGKLWSKVHAGVKLQKAALHPTFHHQKSMAAMTAEYPAQTSPSFRELGPASTLGHEPSSKDLRNDVAVELLMEGALNGDANVTHSMDSVVSTRRGGDRPAAAQARHATGGELEDLGLT